jgi:hypothetical protein
MRNAKKVKIMIQMPKQRMIKWKKVKKMEVTKRIRIRKIRSLKLMWSYLRKEVM